MNNLGTVIAEGTMKAAVEFFHRSTLTIADVDSHAIKTEAKIALGAILDQDQELLSVSPSWQREAINLECVCAGRRAVNTVVPESNRIAS